MGYGGRAMDLLAKHYSGQLASLDEAGSAPAAAREPAPAEGSGEGLVAEKVRYF